MTDLHEEKEEEEIESPFNFGKYTPLPRSKLANLDSYISAPHLSVASVSCEQLPVKKTVGLLQSIKASTQLSKLSQVLPKPLPQNKKSLQSRKDPEVEFF